MLSYVVCMYRCDFVIFGSLRGCEFITVFQHTAAVTALESHVLLVLASRGHALAVARIALLGSGLEGGQWVLVCVHKFLQHSFC